MYIFFNHNITIFFTDLYSIFDAMEFCQRTDASKTRPMLSDPLGHNSTFSRSNRTIIDDLLDHLCDTPKLKKNKNM